MPLLHTDKVRTKNKTKHSTVLNYSSILFTIKFIIFLFQCFHTSMQYDKSLLEVYLIDDYGTKLDIKYLLFGNNQPMYIVI